MSKRIFIPVAQEQNRGLCSQALSTGKSHSAACTSDDINAALHKNHPFCLREFYARVRLAASTTWLISTLVVTLPTPPGTGVMASTMGSTSS